MPKGQQLIEYTFQKNAWGSMDQAIDNTITLHWSNISGAGGSFNQFVKNIDGTTVITFFAGNVGYPNHPTERYTVRNSDYKVIKTEDLFQQ